VQGLTLREAAAVVPASNAAPAVERVVPNALDRTGFAATRRG